MAFKGSQTEQHLKDAFAGESQANRRYLYFAGKADVEGYNDVGLCLDQQRKGKPVTHTAIWSIWSKVVNPPRGCLLV